MGGWVNHLKGTKNRVAIIKHCGLELESCLNLHSQLNHTQINTQWHIIHTMKKLVKQMMAEKIAEAASSVVNNIKNNKKINPTDEHAYDSRRHASSWLYIYNACILYIANSYILYSSFLYVCE